MAKQLKYNVLLLITFLLDIDNSLLDIGYLILWLNGFLMQMYADFL